MDLKDKIIKGNNYLVNQCEKKLESLVSLEKGKFIPKNPKAYNTYKKEAEFRLRYVEAVTQLLNGTNTSFRRNNKFYILNR